MYLGRAGVYKIWGLQLLQLLNFEVYNSPTIISIELKFETIVDLHDYEEWFCKISKGSILWFLFGRVSVDIILIPK